MSSTHYLAYHHLIFRFANAGVHACGIFARNQLIEQLFILVYDPVPIVERTYSFRRSPTKIFGHFGPVFDQLYLGCKLGCIPKQQPMAGKDFCIERIFMRQNAIAKPQGLQKSGIGAAHHVAMDVRVGIAVKLFDVLNAVHVAQEADPIACILFEIIDKSAAVICVAGDRKKAFCWGRLKPSTIRAALFSGTSRLAIK